jgi:hypothetical protein
MEQTLTRVVGNRNRFDQGAIMANSTLDITGEEDPVTGLGHGTRALGPSDSSDSGSDTVGGPGMDEGLSDEQARRMPLSTTRGAGRDLGDPDLDSDSDRAGTGERGSSGPDSGSPVDEQLTVSPGIESAADEFDDPDAIDGDEGESDEDDGSASVSDGAT